MKSTPVLPLPPVDHTCPKCGYAPSREIPSCPECGAGLAGLVPPRYHEMTWMPVAGDALIERLATLPYQEPREHMQITCRRCAFSWPAAPGDSPKEGS